MNKGALIIVGVFCALALGFVGQSVQAQTTPGKLAGVIFSAEERAWLSAHQVIRIGINENWPPMDYVDQKGQPRGIGTAFILAIGKRLPSKIEIVPGPWNKIYDDVAGRRLDALTGITPRLDRRPLFNFTDPYVAIPHVIFTRADSSYVSGIVDLAEKSVAIESGFFLAGVLKESYPSVRVLEYPSTLAALNAVSEGKANAYVGNRVVALNLIQSELLLNLREQSAIRETSSINAIGVRKDWPLLRSILQKALTQIPEFERNAILGPWGERLVEAANIQISERYSAWLAEHPIIRLATGAGTPPLEMANETGSIIGIADDFLRAVNKTLNFRIETKVIPDAEQLKADLNARNTDLVPLVINEKAPNGLVATDPFINYPLVVLTANDTRAIADLADLRGRKVGILARYRMAEVLKRNNPGITFVPIDNIGDALTRLKNERLDAYLDSVPSIAHATRIRGQNDFRIAAPTRHEIRLSFGVRDDWPELVEIMNQVIGRFTELDRSAITQSWVNTRIRKQVDWIFIWRIVGLVLAISATIVAVFMYSNRRLSAEVRERRRAENALQRSQSLLRHHIDNTPLAAVTLDADYRITDWNSAAQSLFGYAREEAMGRSLAQLISGKSGNGAAPEDGPPAPGDERNIREHTTKDGRQIFCEWHETPLRDGGGRLIGAAALIEDITAKLEVQQAMLKSKEAAEEASILKDRFVSLVAHDIRSPLGTIQGFAELIVMSDQLDAAREKLVEWGQSIFTQTRALVDLTTELLDIGRLQTGILQPELKFLDGYFAIEDVLGRVATMAEAKGVEILNDVPEGTRVYADTVLFQQVVQNLLTNAVKFSHANSKVRVAVPDGEPTTIAVTDQGVGIPEDLAETLFMIEEKTSTQGTSGELGTGFGLPISHQIIQAHGGELSFDSVEGVGSSFQIRLPAVQPRILLVDDDPDIGSFVELYLGAADISVDIAANGLEALDRLSTGELPHLVISDIMMPELNGFELLERMKAKESWNNLPVIILTGTRDSAARDRCLHMGADDFVRKPIDPEDLMSRVYRFIS
ncbi:MAG: transporter substrate-binding domain-containing protein [Rhodospirillaceae bacterium]|nr:transporter substrate-binding domain-containing protein [Rhodospirillaceae bacterium]